MTRNERQTRPGSRRWGVTAALVLAVGAAGCDSLLEVNLPAAVTSDALDDPGVAPILVNSVMALVECAYSSFAVDAAGQEDNFQMVTGVAGNYSQYTPTPGGGQCDTDAYSTEWIDPFNTARGQGDETYAQLVTWGSSEQLKATVSIYTAVVLGVFGEFFCESAIDGGPLLTPVQTLDAALARLDNADAAITANGGDFAITTTAGEVTNSAANLADALRARILYSRRGAGDLAAAAALAAGIPDGFMAYVLREDGEKRRNMVASFHGNGGGVQAAGFLQGPVKLKTPTNSYGISQVGSHPNGVMWPDSLPFTGYIDLSIDPATGRAIGDDGYPWTLGEDAGSVVDTRVSHALGNTAGGIDYIETKYSSLSDDIPLANWREMRLIRAEAAGPGAAATAHVNAIRTADGLPPIAGAYLTLVESDADRFRDMLIEERRRALWLEARFWTTKIIYNELLWFPRGVGDLVNAGATYSFGGGVRQLMDTQEYNINKNFDLSARGTGCAPFEAPIGF